MLMGDAGTADRLRPGVETMFSGETIKALSLADRLPSRQTRLNKRDPAFWIKTEWA